MPRFFNFIAVRNWYLRTSFRFSGLKSATTDLGDGTIIHCWVPKSPEPTKPNLLLLHGIGSNALWQWHDFVSPLSSMFNLYAPDLVFFGHSHSTRPDRTESFQAKSVMRAMESYGVRKINVVGLSYGGFVGYSLAAQFPAAVERLVLVCAGVCMEDKDMEQGMFQVSSVDEATCILLAQSPEKMRELVRLTFHKPIKNLPSWFLREFINEMCTKNHEERKELVIALHKDRKLSDLPKITQPTRIIWGEYDVVFPIELAHRLKRHLGEIAELVVLKDAGHAINVEKTQELYQHMLSFLIDPLAHKQDVGDNNNKVD